MLCANSSSAPGHSEGSLAVPHTGLLELSDGGLGGSGRCQAGGLWLCSPATALRSNQTHMHTDTHTNTVMKLWLFFL